MVHRSDFAPTPRIQLLGRFLADTFEVSSVGLGARCGVLDELCRLGALLNESNTTAAQEAARRLAIKAHEDLVASVLPHFSQTEHRVPHQPAPASLCLGSKLV